jgi:putative ABC transport system ATP-binding protein
MITPRLKVEAVTKHYGSGPSAVRAVAGVSLSVNSGEMVLIMGPSGSGKTTLLLMIGALLKPSSGRIVLDGTELSSLPEWRLPSLRLRHIGFVFQDFNLLASLSALENVALVAELSGRGNRQARVLGETLLDCLGLGDRLHFRPGQLSGGERQRVAIARSLVNTPSLILADEPTANLDAARGRETVHLLRSAAREAGSALIVVSHDARIRELADRVLWLEDGLLKALGEMSIDPVCGMPVEVGKVLSAKFAGKDWHFCAPGCREEFLANPAAFTYLADSGEHQARISVTSS